MSLPELPPAKPFRADDWWKSKAAALMGLVYLFALWFRIPMREFLPLALFSIVVIIGFASFGYIINDFFDLEKDRLAGKKNFLLDKSLSFRFGLLLATLIFIAVPWLYLPSDGVSYILIALQLLLFLVYSAPPIRLKERGIAGLLMDSLYAHAVPAVLAAYTFLLASTENFICIMPPPQWPAKWEPYLLSLCLLFLWQCAIGLRNILLHQSEDREADLISKTKNFTSAFSKKKLNRIVAFVLLVELALGFLFFTSLPRQVLDRMAIVTILLIWGLFVFIKIRNTGFSVLFQSSLRYFPNNVYEKWMPALYLILLSAYHIYFAVILMLHLALFNFEFYRQVAKWAWLFWREVYFAALSPLRNLIIKFASFFINYLIYYTLLLAGINLKKENTSAIEYFKNRKKKGQ